MTLNVKRVGLFGGSFDPVHNGHLAVADYLTANDLVDEVVFVPVGLPWQKAKPVASAADRKSMLELSISKTPKFKFSSLEIDRPGVSYTIDTVEELLKKAPQDEIYLVLGADAANSIPTWHRVEELVNRVKLLIIAREQQAVTNLEIDFQFVNMPLVDVSSSMVRKLVSQGLSISHLVPKEVASYISGHKLYQNNDVR